MNKKTIHTLALATAFTLFACDGYLKEDSADLLIPKSVTEFAPLLLGEGYPYNFGSQIDFVNLMTDDVEMGPLYYDPVQRAHKTFKMTPGIDSKAGHGPYAHIWQDDFSTYITDRFWAGRYSNILGCNAIIEALPTMTYHESETGIYRKLAAQAYALRAYNYFCLINTYALPYSKENLSKPGVVLRTSSVIQIEPQARASIGEIYTLINDDIQKAKEYQAGADTRASKFEITGDAIYFLAARIALFQQDWDGVIAAGEKFLSLNSSIYDLNSADPAKLGLRNSFMANSYCANNIELDEVVFGFGRKDRIYNYLSPFNPSLLNYEYGFHTSWTGENALMNLYHADDLRQTAYFEKRYHKSGTTLKPEFYAGQYNPMKFDDRSGTSYSSQAWRTPELYLTLAEAYARKSTGVSEKAVELLNQVRIKKYKTGSAAAVKKTEDFTSQEAFIKFIWQERRRELCFEELTRFWDMRRQGMPTVEHYLFSSAKDYSVYILKAGSPNYVLRIPDDETAYNDGIVNNPRENISASSTGTLE